MKPLTTQMATLAMRCNSSCPKASTLSFIVCGDSLAESINTLKSGGQLISITNSDPDRPDDISFEYVFVEPNAKQLKHIQELADDGKIEVPISKTYALDQAGQALRDIESLHTQGKTVVTP